MDWEAFHNDVWDSVKQSLYTDMVIADDGSGRAFTIGETRQGALYGVEENRDGQRTIHFFDTEDEQFKWFEGVTADAR